MNMYHALQRVQSDTRIARPSVSLTLLRGDNSFSRSDIFSCFTFSSTGSELTTSTLKLRDLDLAEQGTR